MSRLIMSREVLLYITAKSFQFVDKNYNIIIIIKLGKNDNKKKYARGRTAVQPTLELLIG